MRLLRAESVLQVKAVHAELVGGDDHHVVGYLFCHPVMTADGFQPPHLVFVVEGDAVGFISAVLLQQRSQPRHPFPGGADIGQHKHHDVLFPDAAGHVLFIPALGFFVFHQGIGGQHPGIRGDGFGGGHAHLSGVDAGGGPNAVLGIHAGAGGIAHGIVGQVDFQMGNDRFVFSGLLVRCHHGQPFHIERAIVGAGNHGGKVIAGVFADQNSGAGHGGYPPINRRFECAWVFLLIIDEIVIFRKDSMKNAFTAMNI